MEPTVVLLHGLARTRRSMARLARHLEDAGHRTWSCTCPSTRRTIPSLAAWVEESLREDLSDRPLVAVTHSLGGILVRHLADALPWRGVVMLAPPNRGSALARRLKDNRLYRALYGPAGQDVAHPERWPLPPRPFAVIAGTSGPTLGNPPSLLTAALGLLPRDEPSDGTVTVSETRLEGMADFATVPASHTWIMNHPETRRLVLHFLAHGRFPDDAARPRSSKSAAEPPSPAVASPSKNEK
ncbi:MAG: esterase/lipase family protein [Myxococcota bacterium]